MTDSRPFANPTLSALDAMGGDYDAAGELTAYCEMVAQGLEGYGWHDVAGRRVYIGHSGTFNVKLYRCSHNGEYFSIRPHPKADTPCW